MEARALHVLDTTEVRWILSVLELQLKKGCDL